MSKRAEEAALKAYPVEMTSLVYQDLIDQFGGKTEIDVNTYSRRLFQEGYEQAEKNLPRWKKSAGALRYAILEDAHGRYIQHDGYKLYFDDLLKLPKEEEQ